MIFTIGTLGGTKRVLLNRVCCWYVFLELDQYLFLNFGILLENHIELYIRVPDFKKLFWTFLNWWNELIFLHANTNSGNCALFQNRLKFTRQLVLIWYWPFLIGANSSNIISCIFEIFSSVMCVPLLLWKYEGHS